jgi:hypothetical protein
MLLHRSIRTGSSIFANYRVTGRSVAFDPPLEGLLRRYAGVILVGNCPLIARLGTSEISARVRVCVIERRMPDLVGGQYRLDAQAIEPSIGA